MTTTTLTGTEAIAYAAAVDIELPENGELVIADLPKDKVRTTFLREPDLSEESWAALAAELERRRAAYRDLPLPLPHLR